MRRVGLVRHTACVREPNWRSMATEWRRLLRDIGLLPGVRAWKALTARHGCRWITRFLISVWAAVRDTCSRRPRDSSTRQASQTRRCGKTSLKTPRSRAAGRSTAVATPSRADEEIGASGQRQLPTSSPRALRPAALSTPHSSEQAGDLVLLPAHARKELAALVLIEAHTSKRLARLAATHDRQHLLVHVLR